MIGTRDVAADVPSLSHLVLPHAPTPWQIELPDVTVRRGAFVMAGLAIDGATVRGHATFAPYPRRSRRH